MAERSPEIEQKIIKGISHGTPLAVLCRELGVGRRTVYDWRDADPEFAAHIARARESGYDAIASRTRMTARGKGEEEGGDSTGDVQRDKLIIETDLKLLAKWDPKRYGERQLIGSDPENPLPAGFQINLVKSNEAPNG